eukprot:5033047-Alexandrium_andersonii.AAC.1
MLGQNPFKIGNHNKGSNFLQTIIKNCGIMMAKKYKRWITAGEVLLTQNFPFYPCTSMHGEKCSFNSLILPPGRSLSIMKETWMQHSMKHVSACVQ